GPARAAPLRAGPSPSPGLRGGTPGARPGSRSIPLAVPRFDIPFWRVTVAMITVPKGGLVRSATLEDDGYRVVENVIDAGTVAAIRAELVRLFDATPFGRDDFEGPRPRRVYALFAKTRVLDDLAMHPMVLDALERVLGPAQLSAPTAIEIGPGARAQPLHPHDAIYPIPRPHPELVLNVMWPFDDFTEENGATRLVPGSHRWIDERPGPDAATVALTIPA